jgi:hypothetical protein
VAPLCLVVAVWYAEPAAAQPTSVGAVDFYGARTVARDRLQRALGVRVGDSVSTSNATLSQRLLAVPGVAEADVTLVCCLDGRSMIFAGIRESGQRGLAFHAAPTGIARLPREVESAGAAFDSAFMLAVRAGDFAEDVSQGHALMHFAAAHAAQERFIPLAAQYVGQLRDVLRHSADANERALASRVMAYVADKRTVIDDLELAMRDPDSEVRNNATRALWLIARLGQQTPALGIQVPPQPFVDLLNSVVWSDRNKSSFALMELTQPRDPSLLRALRTGALPSLIDIARWTSRNHAMPGIVILGRIGAMPDSAIFARLQSGDVSAVIAAATRAAGK